MLHENSTAYEFTIDTDARECFVRTQNAIVSGVGIAFPERRYTQTEVAALLGIKNPIVQKLLRAPHIQTRHLYLPEPQIQGGAIHEESHIELLQKFERGVYDIGVRAVVEALHHSGRHKSEIEFLICVTSSGFAVPGISSMISRALNLRPDLYRLDVVGMGCNAGMTALQTANALAKQGKLGVLVCCEINSAIYVRDESVRTGIVNSLFGDGAVAIVLQGGTRSLGSYNSNASDGIFAEILDFESYTIMDQSEAMRFDWNDEQKKFSFGLSKQIPFVVGENLKMPVQRLLRRNQLRRCDIQHWTIHTGGAAVIEGTKRSLGLVEHDVRHTRSVLRDYGNISSGSFLVSLQRLLAEDSVRLGDLGIWAAMGPGATLEACLVRYIC